MISTTDTRPLVFLATCREFPDGEPESLTLLPAIEAQGLRGEWKVWNDPSVDWDKADLVTIRATWDYHDHLAEFLSWAEMIGDKLHHDLDIVKWNTNKTYLLELEKLGVPIVPSQYSETIEDLRSTLDNNVKHRAKQIVKPAHGANGDGIEIVKAELVSSPEFAAWKPEYAGPWIVQPFVDSVLTEGETSVFLIDDSITQFSKKSLSGNFLVHEERGGQQLIVPTSDEAREAARQVYDATEKALSKKIGYARLDFLRWDGRLSISEVEITEPALYFDRIARHSELYAKMLAKLVAENGGQ